MKQRFIKAISSIFLAVVLGFICGYILYNTYSKETKYLANNNIVYLLEYQKYTSYDSMKLANINKDYTYYKDKDNYYTVIGFTKNKNNIEKITNIYKDINIIKCYIDNKDFSEKLTIFDKEIENTTDTDKIKEILDNIIKYYNDNKIEIIKVYN